MKGFGGGLQQLMKQANQMQLKMKKTQEELATRDFDGTSGGGAVTVKVTGAMQLTSVHIQPDVFSTGDAEMLQDLFVTAANEALRNAKETSDKEMAKITGGAGLPGMF